MFVINIDSEHHVTGPFKTIALAENYLEARHFEKLSPCYWAGLGRPHSLHARIKEVKKP